MYLCIYFREIQFGDALLILTIIESVEILPFFMKRKSVPNFVVMDGQFCIGLFQAG